MNDLVRSYNLEHLVYSEIRELIDSGCNRVLIPCGATEAHGATGLGTDTIIPRGLAERLAPELDALVAPAVPYGVLKTLRAYPGSVSLSPQVYTQLMTEIGAGLVDTGFSELIFLNGHAGNREGLKIAAYDLHVEHGIRALVYSWFEEPNDLTPQIYDGLGGHSGAGETGMVVAIEPDAAPAELWMEEDAGTLNPAVNAYPGPFPIILAEEGSGLPDFDPIKAEQFLDSVAEKAKNSLLRVLTRWDDLNL